MNKFRFKVGLLIMAAAYQPAFAAGLTNGSFESGLSGWTTLVSGSANPVALATGNIFASAGAIGASPTNDQYAYTSQSGPGYSLLYQNFTVQTGVNKVFFDILINNSAGAFHTPADNLDYSNGSNQQARFEILKPGASPTTTNPSDIIVVVYKTNVGDPNNQAWSTKAVDITAQLAPYAGSSQCC